MFEAKGVRFEDIPPEEEVPLSEGTGAGRGFAVTGGVAGAVVEAIHQLDPEREVKIASAEGLDNCKKMLLMAKAGFPLPHRSAPSRGISPAAAVAFCPQQRDILGIICPLSVFTKPSARDTMWTNQKI